MVKITQTWLKQLEDEDLSFLKRFMLASGSLKKLAADYGVTYPTIRLRLDRLIEKIKILDSQEIKSDFERLVRSLYAQGSIDISVLKALLEMHRSEIEQLVEQQ